MVSILHTGMTRQWRLLTGYPRSQGSDRADVLRWPLVLLLSIVLCACERDGASIDESEYSSALVGDWQGTVGGEYETISFRADGSYSSRLRSMGFISNTLGQGTEGRIGGSWVLDGNVITLTIDGAENEQPINSKTTSTIVGFKQNELVVKSAGGQTSSFSRVM